MDNTLFFDDFSNGIWTKHPGNPVIVRDQPWAESNYICEPNLLYVDGLFRVWFSQMCPPGHGTALGYATSLDGLTWTKHPGNPVLRANVQTHRPSVMRHDGMYYLFAVQHEHEATRATMRRWSSPDGLHWGDERLLFAVTQPWEGGLSNMAVIVDEDGVWRMIYTGGDDPMPNPEFGYAWSVDGVNWTKYDGNPVIRDLYGGDPFLVKIGEWYMMWHSEAMTGSLRIVCRRSRDLIHWERVGGHADVNYTQPWERGIAPEEGGTTESWYGHLTDATLCEADGCVFLMYQGAQTPLGVATFDGTLADLAGRLECPPLSRWESSHFGMVEGGTLKLADNDSERNPLVVKIPETREAYLLETRLRRFHGPTHRVSVVIRYADANTFACLWLHDSGRVYYQECLNGLVSLPQPVGCAPLADDAWHDWEVRVEGRAVALAVDGRPVGQTQSSDKLVRVLAGKPLYVGFSTHDTWAEVAWVRVEAV